MTLKNHFVFICATLTGIAMLFTSFATLGSEQSAGEKAQLKIRKDFAPVPFTRLIGMADLIAIGNVEGVGESTFQFHVDEFLLNHHVSSYINVEKNILPEFVAPRVLPYARGQRFALFLKKDQNTTDHTWKILGIAGEGEMPIEDKYVYFSVYDLEGLKHTPHEAHGVTRKLQRYNLDVFKDAVKNYPTCFSWKLVKYIKNKKERSRWVPSKICPNESILNYQSKSWLHEYLARETMKRIPVAVT